MPAGKFDKLVRLDKGKFKVGGVFVTHGGVIGDVTVRFVLIPDGEPKARTDPIVGTAEIRNGLLPRDPKEGISVTRFDGKAEHKWLDPQRGTVVRGIGIAIAVKAPDPDSSSDRSDPPAFETFTWCVDLEVDEDEDDEDKDEEEE